MIPPRIAMTAEPQLAPITAPTPSPASALASSTRPALRHRPAALIDQLNALAMGTPASPWANEVLRRVESLTAPAASADHDWQPTVAELRILAEQGFSEALAVADPADQSAWIRASRSLDRRMAVWSLLVDRQFMARQTEGVTWLTDNGGLLHALREVTTLTAGAGEGATWRQYLRLDDLVGLTSVGGDEFVEARRATARDVLIRMTDPWLTAEQREFLTQPPLIALAQQLRSWAGGEVSIDTLAAFIERYESTNSLRDADHRQLQLQMNRRPNSQLQRSRLTTITPNATLRTIGRAMYVTADRRLLHNRSPRITSPSTITRHPTPGGRNLAAMADDPDLTRMRETFPGMFIEFPRERGRRRRL